MRSPFVHRATDSQWTYPKYKRLVTDFRATSPVHCPIFSVARDRRRNRCGNKYIAVERLNRAPFGIENIQSRTQARFTFATLCFRQLCAVVVVVCAWIAGAVGAEKSAPLSAETMCSKCCASVRSVARVSSPKSPSFRIAAFLPSEAMTLHIMLGPPLDLETPAVAGFERIFSPLFQRRGD